MSDPSEPARALEILSKWHNWIATGQLAFTDADLAESKALLDPAGLPALYPFHSRAATAARTCDGCRHWGTNPGIEWWHSDGIAPGTQKMCGSAGITDGEEHDPAPDVASAVDCEKYHAFLLTGPKFGCVHWEATPSAMAAELPSSEKAGAP